VTSSFDLLISSFLERHGREGARLLEELGAVAAASVLSSVGKETAAAVLAEMSPAEAGRCLAAMDPDPSSAVLERLPVTRSVSILLPLAEAERARLLSGLSAEHAGRVLDRLHFPPETAGRLMEPAENVMSVRSSHEHALLFMRENGCRWVYLVDADQRLVGVLSRRDAQSREPHADPIPRRPISVPALTSLDAIGTHPAWEEHDELPVVDGHGHLLGLLRHRQLRRAGTRSRAKSPEVAAGIDALVGLGEAYCSGLWDVIGPLTATGGGGLPPGEPADSASERRGGPDGETRS
jgi:magnesium transporter